MSCKALGIALKLSFEGTNQFIFPQTYFFMLVVASAVVTQVRLAFVGMQCGCLVQGSACQGLLRLASAAAGLGRDPSRAERRWSGGTLLPPLPTQASTACHPCRPH